MRIIIFFLLLITSIYSDAQSSGYPGLTPDCWQSHRAVHDIEDNYLIENYLSISQLPASDDKAELISPNNGYSLSWEVSRVQKEAPYSYITINSEKKYQTLLTLENHHGLTEVKWVNENLIFFRLYVGRVVFIDVIFNVESEKVVWSQSARDNHDVIHQWSNACKRHGSCKCTQEE